MKIVNTNTSKIARYTESNQIVNNWQLHWGGRTQCQLQNQNSGREFVQFGAINSLLFVLTIQQLLPPYGGNIRFDPEICTFFCTCHNFFLLSSVQIIIIPACCLLCVL